MPNIRVGQRLKRGNVTAVRTSVALPEDTLELLRKVSVHCKQSPSAIIVQTIELGLRQLAAEGFKSDNPLSIQEIETITGQVK